MVRHNFGHPAEEAEKVAIRWPSGQAGKRTDVAAGLARTVEEPAGE